MTHPETYPDGSPLEPGDSLDDNPQGGTPARRLIATRVRAPDGWIERVAGFVGPDVEPAPLMDAADVRVVIINPGPATCAACDLDMLEVTT